MEQALRKKQFNQFKPGEIIQILWYDSHGEDNGWEEAQKVNAQPPLLSTVGHYVKVSKQAVCVCAATDPHEEGSDVSGISLVPLGCIQRVRRLHPQ